MTPDTVTHIVDTFTDSLLALQTLWFNDAIIRTSPDAHTLRDTLLAAMLDLLGDALGGGDRRGEGRGEGRGDGRGRGDVSLSWNASNGLLLWEAGSTSWLLHTMYCDAIEGDRHSDRRRKDKWRTRQQAQQARQARLEKMEKKVDHGSSDSNNDNGNYGSNAFVNSDDGDDDDDDDDGSGDDGGWAQLVTRGAAVLLSALSWKVHYNDIVLIARYILATTSTTSTVNGTGASRSVSQCIPVSLNVSQCLAVSRSVSKLRLFEFNYIVTSKCTLACSSSRSNLTCVLTTDLYYRGGGHEESFDVRCTRVDPFSITVSVNE